MNVTEIEVLLVEDNPCDAELTLRSLKKHNLANNVVHLKDGQEAVDWLTATGAYAERDINQKPKLVLLDLKLPKLNGLEVLAAIRANEQTSLIPVVMLTSSQEQRDVIESYKLRVNSYIVKPVDFEKFTTAVSEAGHYWLIVNHQDR
jgi:CheY-like chemotaxis protein